MYLMGHPALQQPFGWQVFASLRIGEGVSLQSGGELDCYVSLLGGVTRAQGAFSARRAWYNSSGCRGQTCEMRQLGRHGNI
jgi:hypothetical protein